MSKFWNIVAIIIFSVFMLVVLYIFVKLVILFSNLLFLLTTA